MFEAEEIAYVRTVLDGLAEAVVRFGRPLPRSVVQARGILDRALSLSFERQDAGDVRENSDTETTEKNVGSDELADHLGVSRRTVQRNAEDLGGQRISRTWVFKNDNIGA